MKSNLLAPLRLVGGTALALQYGHRQSVDLDFFGQLELDTEPLREELRNIGKLSIVKESRNIKIYAVDGIKVDFVNYAYAWLEPAVIEEGIRLASPVDIAAMKINAIEERGSKKDFIDVYYLLLHYPLEEILGFYNKKYPEHSMFRALMSLTYFEDAEQNLMPQMYDTVSWAQMKKRIADAVSQMKQ